jgi:RNA polymerase sigma-70 factor (ECF subfamily)
VSFAGTVFLRYGRELRDYLLRRLNRKQEVEDVVQEVFMRLLRIKRNEMIRNPQAYIYGMALHVVREQRMRAERSWTWLTLEPEKIAELAENPEELNPDALADELDLRRQLDRALETLPPMHLRVLLLHKRDGYSYEEVAGKLGLSVNTVDKYLMQAKVKLRLMRWDR